MATASFPAGGDAGPLPGSDAALGAARGSIRGQVALTVVTALAVYFIGPGLGVVLPLGAVAILAFGAIAVELAPARALELSATVGMLLLARLHPTYAPYHIALVAVLFACRPHSVLLAAALAALALVVPKQLFAHHYHQPAWYQWLNEPSLAAAIFATAYWWREAHEGRLPVPARRAPAPPAWPPEPPAAPETTPSSFAAWAILFLFPTHAINPIAFGPGDLWRGRRTDGASVLRGVALFVSKAAALAALRALFPGHRYADLPADQLMNLAPAALWGVVALNYIDLVLVLSGTADLAVALARLYGWSLPSPFRWALLAWNPVELWRRWGIYNRRFLLKTVYFPLGGNTRRLLNVMLTFLASALVLHSGWFGSKYWAVGVAGWRDYAIYFLVQGAAVCACLGVWRAIGKDPGPDRTLRFSWSRVPGTVATQALSAVVHVVILAQSITLAERWRLIARCFGW